MKSKFILVVLLLACVASFSSFLPSEIMIEIPKGYSGWVIVVASSKEPVKDKVILDSRGIGYIDSASLKDDVLFKYYQNGTKLTAHELKFFFLSHVVPAEYNDVAPTDKDYIAHERKIYAFYVLSPEELKKGDEYWDNEKKLRPIDGKSQRHIDEYLRKGWILVQ